MKMKKRIILGISGAISFIIFCVLAGISSYLGGKQDSQNMAQRWSKEKDVAQISCFFSQSAGVSENTLIGFGYQLESDLVAASIVSDSANPNARLWTDAYSATGKITLQSDNGSVTADAVGVGGDFFYFHPLELAAGSYFSGDDVMKDYCLVDEETAWQLFGSNNIAGQMITISGIPHIITGVYSREEGRLAEAAGLDGTVVYVSYETLTKYGQANEIGCYEIVMPNPVEKYAFNYVAEHIGVQETEVEVLENTSRYSLLALAEGLGEFGTRSMNGKSIIYPHWENIARGYEDILMLLLILMLLFIIYPVLLIVIAIVIAWKHKTWTVKSIYLFLQDKWERMLEKRREKKRGRRKNEKMDKA